MAGPTLRLSELFSIRPGFMLQFWGNLTQDSAEKADGESGDFSKNMYLRRARFFMAGGVGKSVTWFLLMEQSNLGQAVSADGINVNKQFAPLQLQDAWFDLKLNPNLSFQAGLMLAPVTRNILQSTSTYWPIDIATVSATNINALQTSVLRDTGVQLKINAVENHFEARVMASQGIRRADGPGRGPGKNNPRLTAYVQYNFLDPDAGYVFNGQYFGRKKIAGVAVGFDRQKAVEGEDAYTAYTGTLFAAIPVGPFDAKAGGDEVGGQLEYLHFDPGGLPANVIIKQDCFMAELGYYNKKSKFSVFAKYEGRFLDSETVIGVAGTTPVFADSANSNVIAGGLKYFLAESAANLTLQYNYTMLPNSDDDPRVARNSTSAIQAQLQLAYF